MSNEYIYRNEAIDACFNGWNIDYKDIAENISKLPAADVVSVGRCKDCAFYPTILDEKLNFPKIDGIYHQYVCPFECDDPYYSKQPDPDFFCKNWKRRLESND